MEIKQFSRKLNSRVKEEKNDRGKVQVEKK